MYFLTIICTWFWIGSRPKVSILFFPASLLAVSIDSPNSFNLRSTLKFHVLNSGFASSCFCFLGSVQFRELVRYTVLVPCHTWLFSFWFCLFAANSILCEAASPYTFWKSESIQEHSGPDLFTLHNWWFIMFMSVHGESVSAERGECWRKIKSQCMNLDIEMCNQETHNNLWGADVSSCISFLTLCTLSVLLAITISFPFFPSHPATKVLCIVSPSLYYFYIYKIHLLFINSIYALHFLPMGTISLSSILSSQWPREVA